MKKPTEQQWIAFRLIYQEDKTQEEAAEIMGITRPTVNEHIAALKRKVPGFDALFEPNRKKPFPLRDTDDEKIIRKF